MDLPQAVLDYNKEKKNFKIAFLSDAKALHMKRFHSGSFGINSMLGGGWAFKRIQLLYGAKSAGKNSTLYQTSAFNQRICRNCEGVLPEFSEPGVNDRWADTLIYLMGVPRCNCKAPQGRVILFMDYEKSLSIETAKTSVLRSFADKTTGEEINENDYNEANVELGLLKETESLTEKQLKRIEFLEKYIQNIAIETETVDLRATTDYLQDCGVFVDRLLVTAPEDAEEGIDMMRPMIKSKSIDMIIWDSLQAAIPKYVNDRSSEDATMGQEAKQNGILMRKIASAYSPENICDEREAYLPAVFLTAQVRSVISFFAAADKYSGGKAVEHFISAALEFKRGDKLDSNGLIIGKTDKKAISHGQVVNIRAEKNKLSAPNTSCSFNYYFKKSDSIPVGFIDYFDELTTIAVDNGIITQGGGGNYSFGDEKIRGKEALVQRIKSDPSFVKSIYEKVKNI